MSVINKITIADQGTTSTAMALPQDYYPAGLIIPAMTTSTTLSFTVSTDGVTYYPLHSTDGTIYTITFANTTAVTLDPSKFYAWEYIKVVVPNAQTGIKTIGVVVREY